jgi:hypothetical protein
MPRRSLGLGGARFASSQGAPGLQPQVRLDQELMLAQQAQAPLLVHGLLLHEAPGDPHDTIPPERMGRLERPAALQ